MRCISDADEKAVSIQTKSLSEGEGKQESVCADLPMFIYRFLPNLSSFLLKKVIRHCPAALQLVSYVHRLPPGKKPL